MKMSVNFVASKYFVVLTVIIGMERAQSEATER